MRIAIIGGGIAGLGCAHLLGRQGHAVTLFEAEDRLGGHSHTVDVSLEGQQAGVDTGFLVFNDRTYPRFIALMAELGVASTASEMSFSVRNDAHGLEWAGTSLAALFAQPLNALRPAFWRMLRDILRFNKATTAALQSATLDSAALAPLSLGAYLDQEGYGIEFRDWYLLPMAAAIWSSPRARILEFPLASFVRFCHNHGLLQIRDRPQWRTITGGSRNYVARLAAGIPDLRLATPVQTVRRHALTVEIVSAAGREHFDQVVLACHSDQALRLLETPDTEEAALLGAIAYQDNAVILHTDTRLLPRARRAWSAWNYLATQDASGERPVAVSYLLNKLQPLPFRTPIIVTLNAPFEPDPLCVLRRLHYAHPILDAPAVAAQRALAARQGRQRTWFAGAWLGYGFHEDGLASAHAVSEALARATGAGAP